MKTQDFNEESQAPRYTYKRSPIHERAFMILRYQEDLAGEPQPVGDYTVLDVDEDTALSEKKVMNLISLLNERRRLMDLGVGLNTRLLYRIVDEQSDDSRARVIFYKLELEGVSKENAILQIDPDCIDLKEAGERQCAGASDSSFVRPEVQQSYQMPNEPAPEPKV